MNLYSFIKDSIKKNSQVFILLLSSAGSTALSLLVSILNTHSLSPEDYGNVRYVFNAIMFFASFLFFGYFNSGSRLLALEESEIKRRMIRGTLIKILFLIIIVNSVFLFLYSLFFSENRELQKLLQISILFGGAPIFLNYVNTVFQGENFINRIGLARTLPAFLYLIIGYTVYALYGATSTKMVLLQNGISAIVLFIIIFSSKPIITTKFYYFDELQAENKKYGWPLYCGALTTSAFSYLAGITLGYFSNNNSPVAYYSLALQISGPMALIPTVIGTVFFKKFTTYKKIPTKLFVGSIIITVISWIAFCVLIKYVFLFFYSEKYYIVAKCCVWTGLAMMFHGFGDMVNKFLGAHGLGKQIRNGAILSGAVLLVGNVFLVYFFMLKGALLTRILGSMCSCGSMLYYYYRFLKENRNE